jgi:signal transduction histidine kinase
MFEVFANLIALQLENDDRASEAVVALSNERTTSQLREQFIAVLGHDLRNPLSAVSATAELLMLKRSEPELVKLGQRLQATTSRMARLIDDVMDFARGRLGSGIGITVAPTPDLESALRGVVDELCDANPDREINAAFALNQIVRCDRTRVQQLLSNLLGNAITHGAENHPITVMARIENEQLIISVANGGDLIGPETLGKVFEPYWRPASSKPGGGLGLGLYICKQIVKAHNGILEVRSSAEDGTCFVARMPVDNILV